MVPSRGVLAVKPKRPQEGDTRQVCVFTRHFDNTKRRPGLRTKRRFEPFVVRQPRESVGSSLVVLHMPGDLGREHADIRVTVRIERRAFDRILRRGEFAEIELDACEVQQSIDIRRRHGNALLKELRGLFEIANRVRLLGLLKFPRSVVRPATDERGGQDGRDGLKSG